jgi:hypothetical protein
MKIEGIELDKIIWSQPLNLKKWCLIFDIDYKKSRNTLAQWFKDQTIRNRQVSPRYWRVHIEDLPAEYVTRILFAKALENSKGSQIESE